MFVTTIIADYVKGVQNFILLRIIRIMLYCITEQKQNKSAINDLQNICASGQCERRKIQGRKP